MLFSSMVFLWGFLPIVIFSYFLVDTKYKNMVLLLSSFFFYFWGEPRYIFLMITSITINYVFGLLIIKSSRDLLDKVLVSACVFLNLGILAYFKYLDFLIENINMLGVNMSLKRIVLPIGISFYTFQALSYVIDVYIGKKTGLNKGVKVQKNFANLALYISFFPQLIAGPIINYKDVANQIEDRESTAIKIAYGIKRFIYGLSKKVLISNVLAENADKIFSLNVESWNTPITWIGILCYTFQIYYDFSGYSDMAIGLGKIFGFDFMENFNYPYMANSVKEFWRRWHISLSNWFREYLYIPLGGSRISAIRTYMNLGLIFFCTGIWHGANWTFVVWGMWHGCFMVIERIFLSNILEKTRYKIVNYVYTGLVVMIGWVFFRVEELSEGIEYIKMMFSLNIDRLESSYLYLSKETLLILMLAILFAGIIQKVFPKLREMLYSEQKTYSYEIILLPILLFMCILKLTSGVYNPFIYFQF